MPLITHGQARGRRSLTYMSCAAALDRCYNPANKSFARYRSRGITVAPRWWRIGDFVAGVLREIGPRPKGTSLDRIDNRRGYVPGNLRWSTPRQQRRNQAPSPRRTS